MGAPTPLPKPGSTAARALWDRLRVALDLPRTVVVVEGALDRKTLDDVLQKATRGGLGRVGSLSRAEVVGRLTDLFHGHEETATALMKELDKSCHKERHIVASIEESALTERLQSYRALDFRRERARLVWALLRDGRDAHFAAASRILDEAFAQLAAKDEADAALAALEANADVAAGLDAGVVAASVAASDAAAVVDVAAPASPGGHPPTPALAVLRQRMSGYEQAIQEQQKALQQEVVSKAHVERERAELVARLGARENALRQEEQRFRIVTAELHKSREQLQRTESELQERSDGTHQAVVDENARLKERLRALERAAERAARVVDLEEQLGVQQAQQAQQQQQHARVTAELDEQLRLLQARERGALHRVEELREQLREARQQLARPDRGPPTTEPTGKRVGIFVDDANLSASARRDLGSKLDHRELLRSLIDGREKVVAIAYVVDSPDTPRARHEAFVRSLREQGWEVREKRARVRHDGSRKADWDMGIAMEILDAVDDVDVVVIGSGDGDFVPLVKRLKRLHKRVEVAAFRASTDEALIAAADAYTGLDGRFRLA